MSKASFEAARARFGAGITSKLFSALKKRLERNRGVRQLNAMDDFMLKDIGLSRADIVHAAHGRIRRHG